MLNRLIDRLAALIFGYRLAVLVGFAILAALLAASASRLTVDAGFNKMVPLEHPYMKVYRDYEKVFGGANRIAVAIVRKDGDIFNRDTMAALKSLTDDVFLLNGVDRPSVKSLFTPNTRFIEVIEEGFSGGNVVPATFQGTEEDLRTVRANVQKSAEIGRTVATDLKGALVTAGLLEVDPRTGQRLDYFALSASLEALRAKYENADQSVHIIGFAKAVGDIRDGARGVLVFFGLAFVITAALMVWFVKDVAIAAVTLGVALLPVLLLLGTLPVLGYGIDPLSILVPFLVFSIGVSHAVQMVKAWEHEVVSGQGSLEAAKRSFGRLFVPGTLALVTNALGFAVIMLIPIDIVRELGVTASLGVAWMILTNKLLLPVLLSFLKLRLSVVRREAEQERRMERLWRLAAALVDRRRALAVLGVATVILAVGIVGAHQLKIGDYGIGVPELRPESRYNRDNAVIAEKFAMGTNTLGVVAQTQGLQGACTDYEVMNAIERFDWHMQQAPGTQSVVSLPGLAKVVNAGFNEGNLKWRQLPRDPRYWRSPSHPSIRPRGSSTPIAAPCRCWSSPLTSRVKRSRASWRA